jgi:hypothetical protein
MFMERGRPTRSFVVGLVLIAAGVSTLVERAHIFEHVGIWPWWPLALVAVGLARMASGPAARRRGWLLLGLGVCSLVATLTSISFAETWPLVLMIWGGSMIWRAAGSNIGPHAPWAREN